MRVLIAVVHTVFSRFDAEGRAYDLLELGEKTVPATPVDENNTEEYEELLFDTWLALWQSGKFPEIVNEYLNEWQDRFFLFDEQYPFFQVTKNEIRSEYLSKPSPSMFSGKNMNRLISESENKISLFSPKNGSDTKVGKETLSAPEVARWLIALHGYIGLSDKVIFGKEKYKASKGWLFDLGGVFLQGENLFETLLLNCVLPGNSGGNLEEVQRPCWEVSPAERIAALLQDTQVYNFAELYTAWSRAVYIDPDIDLNSPFACSIVKLPELRHEDNFLEPMTLWRYNKTGENRDHSTPKKHVPNQSLWRSFSLVTVTQPEAGKRCPGVIDWLRAIKRKAYEEEIVVGGLIRGIASVSMESDGNATSWVPTDEIVDFLPLRDFIVTDVAEHGWMTRINDVIEQTKQVIEITYKEYLKDIKTIRNISSDAFVARHLEQAYFAIDKDFRQWLMSIDERDDQLMKLEEWKRILKRLITAEAEMLFKTGTVRDFVGIEDNAGIRNIASAFNWFMYSLNSRIKI